MLNSNPFLQSILDHLNVGLVVVDRDHRIVVFNRLAGDMLHEDPQERCGSTLLSCHPRESEGPLEKLMRDLRDGVLDHYEGWVNYRGRMLYEYILPMRGPDGEYLGMIDELHDAAEGVQMMRRLGERKDVHVSGVGGRAPRQPEFGEENRVTHRQVLSWTAPEIRAAMDPSISPDIDRDRTPDPCGMIPAVGGRRDVRSREDSDA